MAKKVLQTYFVSSADSKSVSIIEMVFPNLCLYNSLTLMKSELFQIAKLSVPFFNKLNIEIPEREKYFNI